MIIPALKLYSEELQGLLSYIKLITRLLHISNKAAPVHSPNRLNTTVINLMLP